MKYMLNDETKRLVEAVIEGHAAPDEQIKLMSLLARDENVRNYYAALENERRLLDSSFKYEVEPPAGLQAKIVAALAVAVTEPKDGPVIEFQIKEPDHDERVIRFDKPHIGIGRGSESELKLEDNDVSRSHCEISYRDGRYHIKDTGSKNGVIVNDVKVTECDLGTGDIIRLGSTLLKVVSATELGKLTSTGEITRSDEIVPAYLTYFFNGAEGKFELKKDIVAIGRGTDVDLRFDDDAFSRRHCCIERVFDQYQLVDLGSTNGTMLNGTQALMEDLKDGDRIRIGNIEMVFHNPASAVAMEEELVPMGERTIMALMPETLKPKPEKKLDPLVLEQRRARLQTMLEGREESTNLVKWISAVAAGLILLGVVGLIIINATRPSDKGPKYDVAAAKAALLEVKQLQSQNKHKDAIDRAELYMRSYINTPYYAELRSAKLYSEQKLNDIDWAKVYEQAYREFAQIKTRIPIVKDDPIALNELYTEYRLWQAKYKDRDESLIRKSESKPIFSTLIAESVSYSFDVAKGKARAKARDSYFGEAITTLTFYKKRYENLIKQYYPEKWANYLEELDTTIAQYANDAKEEFEYNYSLAEFYIRENMMKEAMECLNNIIERYGIPEYTKLAQEKLAAIGRAPTKPDPTVTPTATVVAPERYTESESDRMVQRYAFAEAIKHLTDYRAAMLNENVKNRITPRIEEIQSLSNIFDWMVSTFTSGETIDIGGGLGGKLKSVDRKGMILATQGGEMTKKWDSYKPRELYALMQAREKKAAKSKSHFVDLSVFCLEFNMRREALTNLSAAYRADDKLKPALDMIYARYSQKPLPKDGFIVYKEQWLTPEELAVVKLRESVDEAVVALGNKDEAARTKALEDLKKLADTDKNLVISQLTSKLSELLEEIKKSPVLKAITTIDKLHEELRARRKEALRVIFDKNIYPDENHGIVGQPTVDEYVNKVREIYKTPIKDVVNNDPKLRDLVGRAREIQECLTLIGFDHGEGMIDLDTLLEALNSQININTTLNANEMRIYTFSMKIKDYNELLSIPGKRNGEEKKVVTFTNEYRLMMGLPYLRIDRLIVKAARTHSYNMSKRGFFAHEDPVDGTNPFKRMANAGYSDGSGENIARGMFGPDGAFLGWYNSSGHHRNMLSQIHTEIGVGVFDTFWTQNFGKGGVNVEDVPDNANIPNCGEDLVD